MVCPCTYLLIYYEYKILTIMQYLRSVNFFQTEDVGRSENRIEIVISIETINLIQKDIHLTEYV